MRVFVGGAEGRDRNQLSKVGGEISVLPKGGLGGGLQHAVIREVPGKVGGGCWGPRWGGRDIWQQASI